MKNVALIVRSTPFNTLRYAEALRIGVGQTLCDNRVSIFLMDQGAWNALEIHPGKVRRPDISESLDLLSPLKIHCFVDAESLEGIPVKTIAPHVEVIQREEVWDRIRKADVVMNF